MLNKEQLVFLVRKSIYAEVEIEKRNDEFIPPVRFF